MNQNPFTEGIGLFQSFFAGFARLYQQYLEPIVGPYIPLLKSISVIVSLIFFAGIVYAVLKLRDANWEYHQQFKPIDIEEGEARKRTTQWEVIHGHLDAENPAEWRLAILEADNILDGLLYDKGIPGENLGERLKSMTTSDLLSLDDAWEAHKVRNRIAHDGSTFDLSNREARRVISLYETVFRELDYL